MAIAEAVLEVRFAGLGLQHSAAHAGIAELMADLRGTPKLRAREHAETENGLKGAPVELLVTLGASGTVAGLTRIVRLWLSRDKRRSLTVRLQNSAKETVVSVEGDQISVDALTKALDSAIKLDQDSLPS
jgi:hypothetical protein